MNGGVGTAGAGGTAAALEFDETAAPVDEQPTDETPAE
jgi:hypothetical protein